MADNKKRDNDRTIAPGSIDPMIDTVYRVGGADPYGPGNYYSQSQLNNNMSGNDANAIYYATHDQKMDETWNDYPSDPDENARLIAKANEMLANYQIYNQVFPNDYPGGQALNEVYRRIGLKPNTARQEAGGVNDYNAYVTGADGLVAPDQAHVLTQGLGSFLGIPDELLQPGAKQNLYAQMVQRMIDENILYPKA